MLEKVLECIEASKKTYLEQLKDWIRIPSISADPKYKQDVMKSANYVADDLRSSGFDVELITHEGGNPLVYAEWMKAPGKPTALVYGHYDVQPVDPLNEWKSEPFEPTERNGNLYARGATDDKGQLFTHIKAVEAWLKTTGSLPINVKFILEGEEESGGDSLYKYIKVAKEKLKCDFCVVSDSSQFGPGQPAITYGLKGMAGIEFVLTGPSQDLHSGTFGGAITNPGNALCKIVAALHDENRRVTIPGFYDDVKELASWEREAFSKLGFSDKEFFESVGVSGGIGEKGYTPLERKWARPTCDVNGITCGYQGVGTKTIIPAKASAKVTFRLVPSQSPKKVLESLKKYITSLCPEGLKVEFIDEFSSGPVLINVESKYMSSAVEAIKEGFGTKPVFIREGGSIPIVLSFKEDLGVDTLLLGWGQNDDNLHSPNEKFSIDAFYTGIKTSAILLDQCGKIK